jgi:hypothetical protein
VTVEDVCGTQIVKLSFPVLQFAPESRRNARVEMSKNIPRRKPGPISPPSETLKSGLRLSPGSACEKPATPNFIDEALSLIRAPLAPYGLAVGA